MQTEEIKKTLQEILFNAYMLQEKAKSNEVVDENFIKILMNNHERTLELINKLNKPVENKPGAIMFDVLDASYGFTICTDGELHGLIAGDMGYEPTGIKLDCESLEIWNLGVKEFLKANT